METLRGDGNSTSVLWVKYLSLGVKYDKQASDYLLRDNLSASFPERGCLWATGDGQDCWTCCRFVRGSSSGRIDPPHQLRHGCCPGGYNQQHWAVYSLLNSGRKLQPGSYKAGICKGSS